MSCWRVLDLSEEPDGERIPQLLIKPVFASDSYQVYLTDLSNIWGEQLDLHDIVDRASQEQSPIEVSRQDTTQLTILFDNVSKSLKASVDTLCRMTRDEEDGIILHTSISLPEPLGLLSWRFRLKKRPSSTLKNELILPLLVSSHIQHQRITRLVSTVKDKDKAITRLVDQYESSNLDLATAFPSIGSLKSGRKMIRREQAAKHVPALQPFREQVFMSETGQLEDSGVTTLGLFQEALMQSTSEVPSQLKSEDDNTAWWMLVPDRLRKPRAAMKPTLKDLPSTEPKKAGVDASEDETEDEFETHENFKTRNIPNSFAKASVPTLPAPRNRNDKSDDESTEYEDDLDALPKSQIRNQAVMGSPPTHHASSPPSIPPPAINSKAKGFRIGGKSKKLAAETPPHQQDEAHGASNARSQVDQEARGTPKKPRRPFKIGGKGKETVNDEAQHQDISARGVDRIKKQQSSPVDRHASPPPHQAVKEESPIVEEHEEMPEEKAERKRAELKRKNEEAAKKQVQNKKKKRF